MQEAAGKLDEAAKAWRGAVRAAASPAERDEFRRLQLAAVDKRQQAAFLARRREAVPEP